MTLKTLVPLLSGIAIAGSPSPAAAPDQTYPGQPTQARVFIENREPPDAIPVTVHQVNGGAPLRVQLTGTPAVAIASAAVLDTRHARQTWEYQRLLVANDDDPTAELNRLGKEGWEAAAQYSTPRGNVVFVMKRPR